MCPTVQSLQYIEDQQSGKVSDIFNRPGVVGAVLQTPPSLIHLVSDP